MSEMDEATDGYSPSLKYKETAKSLLDHALAGIEAVPMFGHADDLLWRKKAWVASGDAHYLTDVSRFNSAGIAQSVGSFLRIIHYSEEGFIDMRFYYYRPSDGVLQVANDVLSNEQYRGFKTGATPVEAYTDSLKDELLSGVFYTSADDEYMDFLCDLKTFEEDQ